MERTRETRREVEKREGGGGNGKEGEEEGGRKEWGEEVTRKE